MEEGGKKAVCPGQIEGVATKTGLRRNFSSSNNCLAQLVKLSGVQLVIDTEAALDRK